MQRSSKFDFSICQIDTNVQQKCCLSPEVCTLIRLSACARSFFLKSQRRCSCSLSLLFLYFLSLSVSFATSAFETKKKKKPLTALRAGNAFYIPSRVCSRQENGWHSINEIVFFCCFFFYSLFCHFLFFALYSTDA